METITVQVGRKAVQMQLVSVENIDNYANLKAEMHGNGWQPWVGFAKRPNGGVHHMVYRSAKTNNYVSVQTI